MHGTFKVPAEMTLRDAFAIAVLPIILGDEHQVWSKMAEENGMVGMNKIKMATDIAYGVADEMLIARQT